jgi:hypothetical protein
MSWHLMQNAYSDWANLQSEPIALEHSQKSWIQTAGVISLRYNTVRRVIRPMFDNTHSYPLEQIGS